MQKTIFRRKAFPSSCLFTLGVFLAGIVIEKGISILFVLLGIGHLLCLYVLFRNSFKSKYLVFFILGFSIMLLNNYYIVQQFAPENGDGYVECRILYAEEKDYGLRLVCRTEMGKVQVYWYNPEAQKEPEGLIGFKVRVNHKNSKGELLFEKPEKASNPRCFDYRKYLYGKGIYQVAYLNNKSIEIIDDDNIGLYLKFKRFLIGRRESFLNQSFPTEESRAFARGIMFGDTSQLDEDLYTSFRINNTAHILAVSGLHIGIIYQNYSFIKKKIKNKTIKVLFTGVFSFFLISYGIMTLWSSSITRAIILVFIKMIAERKQLKYDLLNSISVVNLIILVFRPFQIYSMGFQMSFLCAYGISIVIPRLKGKIPDFIALPCGIQIFMLLYTIRLNNNFSPLGILSNMAVVFIASIYVSMGVFTFLLGLGIVKSHFLSPLGRMIVWIDQTIYSGGDFSIQIPSPNLSVVGLYMIIMVILSSEAFIVFKERSKKNGDIQNKNKAMQYGMKCTALIISVISILWFADSTPFDKASQIFIDVGQGDAFHLSWDKKKDEIDIMIDGGGRYNYDVGNKVLKQYLLRNGNNDIDIALITHDHMDHYKGIVELMEDYDVKELIIGGEAGDRITIDDDRYIEILWPISDYETGPDNDSNYDDNYLSRIFMVNDKGIKTLITGDITSEGEKALLDEYSGTGKLNCHILKVAHHGSNNSSTEAFLREVSPMVAVISVGKNNNYGHPAPDVIEKMEDLGIIVYRTDEDGAVGIVPKKDGFSVCTAKTDKMDRYRYGI